jgi:hypothetical protein
MPRQKESGVTSEHQHAYRLWALGLLGALVVAAVGHLYNRSLERSRAQQERHKEAISYYRTLGDQVEQSIVGWRSIASGLERGVAAAQLRKAYGSYAVRLSDWRTHWDANRVLVCEYFGPQAAEIYVRDVSRPFRRLQDSLRYRLKTPAGKYRSNPSREPLAFRIDSVADGFRALGRHVSASRILVDPPHPCSALGQPASSPDESPAADVRDQQPTTPRREQSREGQASSAARVRPLRHHAVGSATGRKPNSLENTDSLGSAPAPSKDPVDYSPDTVGAPNHAADTLAPDSAETDYAPDTAPPYRP